MNDLSGAKTNRMVSSTGIEPVFPASEASGLSVNLRGRGCILSKAVLERHRMHLR